MLKSVDEMKCWLTLNCWICGEGIDWEGANDLSGIIAAVDLDDPLTWSYHDRHVSFEEFADHFAKQFKRIHVLEAELDRAEMQVHGHRVTNELGAKCWKCEGEMENYLNCPACRGYVPQHDYDVIANQHQKYVGWLAYLHRVGVDTVNTQKALCGAEPPPLDAVESGMGQDGSQQKPDMQEHVLMLSNLLDRLNVAKTAEEMRDAVEITRACIRNTIRELQVIVPVQRPHVITGGDVKYVTPGLECEKCGSQVTFTNDGERWHLSCACTGVAISTFHEWSPVDVQEVN